MPAGSASTSLSITNPLVLYRTLVATNKINPDPAQHRLALHLQKLYFRLKDYSPELEYRHRLDQIARSVPPSENVSKQGPSPRATPTPSPMRSLLRSFFRNPSSSSILALTRTTPIHQSAISIDSPQGLLLYGDVGRGKSMLLDLLYSSLPSRKKRRWHFNTFMLDVFRRLERERMLRQSSMGLGLENEHVVLSLAKDTVSTSPILFLDEFQMPDRASSKILNGFMTGFFHLGGVLVASSNRMPDELAKASGAEFSAGRGDARGVFSWGIGRGRSPGEEAAKSDFGLFLEVLKARCDVWEMEGERDWRKEFEEAVEGEGEDSVTSFDEAFDPPPHQTSVAAATPNSVSEKSTSLSSDTPRHYHIALPTSSQSASFTHDLLNLNPSQQWTAHTLHIYSRTLHLPTTHTGVCLSTFPALCAANLGPADYITLCSTFHTLILTDVPVLTLLQKNEARRFITLLDALYEAKCRLLVGAEAPVDKLFFPETRHSNVHALLEGDGRGADRHDNEVGDREGTRDSDAIESEAFSEMYQDSTAPFRPNVSVYAEVDTSANPSTSLYNRQLRSVLADEDADFGPTYGNGRSHGMSVASSAEELAELERRQQEVRGPDFTNVGVLTGEDERFAYKRARSRLWEMCGTKWWRERGGDVEEWWKPVQREGNGRFWEGVDKSAETADSEAVMPDGSHDGKSKRVDEQSRGSGRDEGLFRHGASPYRTVSEPPLKFGWQHAWGMMKWGRKAGEWGKGVEVVRRSGRRAREEEVVVVERCDGLEKRQK